MMDFLAVKIHIFFNKITSTKLTKTARVTIKVDQKRWIKD